MAQTTIQQPKKYDFDRVVRMVLTLISVAIGVWLINYLSPVLMPFVVGFILAYIIDPLVEWLQRKVRIKSRGIAVVLALIIVIAVIAGLCWLIIPYLIDEFGAMSKQLAAYAKSNLRIPYVPAEINDFIQRYIDLEKINEMFSKQQWMDIVNKALSGAWSVVGGTMSVIFNIVSWFIVLLYMFFILLDFNKLSRAFKAAIPSKYRRMALRIFGDVADTMSRYFRGQAAVSFFVGVIFAIEFYIIGLPMAIAFGMFVGLLNMVPYLQLISIPIAAFLCLVATAATGGSFWVMFAWVILAYIICQIIQDMVLIPTIMKSQMGLNPAIIFLSLSLWVYVMGFIGLIIGLPLTTLIISYYCEFVLHQPNPLNKDKLKKEIKDKKTPLAITSSFLDMYRNEEKKNKD
ncbi:MAG: AI-2E family transporter [Muribaculaceae bacterium]|nr:AI-2E family transporter [Muribaculaceae bacterium]